MMRGDNNFRNFSVLNRNLVMLVTQKNMRLITVVKIVCKFQNIHQSDQIAMYAAHTCVHTCSFTCFENKLRIIHLYLLKTKMRDKLTRSYEPIISSPLGNNPLPVMVLL